MLNRIILAVIVALVVGLVCLLLGSVLSTINAPIALIVGSFLVTWAWGIGILFGLWYFFRGGIIL